MSRAYRITVSESLRKVVSGSDHVSTDIQLLEILPREQMAELLAEELKQRGFEDRSSRLVKEFDSAVVEIDPATGKVTVTAEFHEELELQENVSGWADEDFGARGKTEAEERLRDQAKQSLKSEAESEQQTLSQQATDQLEAVLKDLQQELDSVVNRVTAKALKQKAAQLGEIKALTEDLQNGSMTIVLEV